MYNSLMYNKYSEFSLYCYWIMLIFKPFQIQIRVWRWLFESLYKRTRREISLWQTWLWILWYSNAACCQNRGSQISITIQGKKFFYSFNITRFLLYPSMISDWYIILFYYFWKLHINEMSLKICYNCTMHPNTFVHTRQ